MTDEQVHDFLVHLDQRIDLMERWATDALRLGLTDDALFWDGQVIAFVHIRSHLLFDVLKRKPTGDNPYGE